MSLVMNFKSGEGVYRLLSMQGESCMVYIYGGGGGGAATCN